MSERQELSDLVGICGGLCDLGSGTDMIMEAVSVHRAASQTPATTSLKFGGKVRRHKLESNTLKESESVSSTVS